ncbi:hypothetical protein D3C72_310340 [compost metagenome]
MPDHLAALRAFGHRLLAPFALGDNASRHLTAVVALVRILAGLLLLHRMVDILGLAAVSGDGPMVRLVSCLVALGAGLMTVGLFTPLAIAGLLLYFAFWPLVFNLGTMVTGTLLWGLLLLGAGRTHSLDAHLLRTRAGRWLGRLYVFGESGDRRHVAKARFLVVVLFWGNCVTAMLFHLHDTFWLEGHVLQFALTAPYISDHYALTRAFQQQQPALFMLLCRVGLGVQAVWELLLLPLMYARWGRVFVVLQGLGFFSLSLVLMNLQYLPLFELLLWLLLFGPAAAGWLAGKLPAGPERPVRPVPEWPRPSWALTTYGTLAVLVAGCFSMVFQIVLAGPLVPERYTGRVELIRQAWLPLFRVFQQRRVNVFNRDDLNMSNSHLVLQEVDAAGRHLRVVPWQDLHGGRLDYLRNDLVYFNHSLRWQRAPWAAKFVESDPTRPAPLTLEFGRRIATLDAVVTGTARTRFYRAHLYVRRMRFDTTPPRWSKARPTASFSIAVTPQELEAYRHWPNFNLPPGQAFGEDRLRQTDEVLAQVADD